MPGIDQVRLSQISTRVLFTLTHRILPSRHSIFSRTSRFHLSPYGSKPSSSGSQTSYQRLRAPPTSRNSTYIFSSPQSLSKPSWMPWCGRPSTSFWDVKWGKSLSAGSRTGSGLGTARAPKGMCSRISRLSRSRPQISTPNDPRSMEKRNLELRNG